MNVAIVTVGDELLAGDTVNENAAWLAGEITRRGGKVDEILTIGDDRERIASAVRTRASGFDRIIVTGGLGGTPDDVTMEGVAAGLDRDLIVDPGARESARQRSEAFIEAHPDLDAKYDLGLDLDRVAEIVAGGRVLNNPEGVAQGCAVENVYVFPGVPSELQATFEEISHEFEGDVRMVTRFTDAPEGVLAEVLGDLETNFEVRAGSYPGEHTDQNRVRITGSDEATIDAALQWLEERVTVWATSDGSNMD